MLSLQAVLSGLMHAEAGVNAGLGGSSEAVPSTSHQKSHSGQHHSTHGKKHQHSAAGSEGGAGAPGSQALAGASGGSKPGAGGSAAVLAGAMHDLAAATGVPVPAPGPAGGPLASVLPPAGVRHSPTIGAAKLCSGPMAWSERLTPCILPQLYFTGQAGPFCQWRTVSYGGFLSC